MSTPESPATPDPDDVLPAAADPADQTVEDDEEEEDEQARAELYGLLARLWLAPPDNAVLAEFRLAVRDLPDTGAPLDDPWRALVAALRATDVPHATAEHDALFGATASPAVALQGRHYLDGGAEGPALADLREDLRSIGLVRDALPDRRRGDAEDHVANGFEVMRYLIAGDDAAVCTPAQQRRYFQRDLQPWVGQLCDAVDAHPRAVVWRALSGFTRAFMQVEAQAFGAE